MNSERNHWKLGAFALAVMAAAVGALIWLGATRFSEETYLAVTYLDESVQGLDEGAPVKFRGVTIGNVDDITIAPDRSMVQITAEIQLDEMMRLGLRSELPDPESGLPFIDPGIRTRLANAGITGLKFLEVDMYEPAAFPAPRLTFETPWNYIPSVPSTLKSIEESLVTTLEMLPQLLDEGRMLLSKLNSTVDGLDVAGLSSQASELLAKIDERIAAIDPDLAATTLEDTSALIAEGRALVEQLNRQDGPLFRLFERLDNLTQTFDGVAHKVDTQVDGMQLTETTASFRRSANSVTDLAVDARSVTRELHEDLITLREALEAVRALMAMLERDPSSLIHGKSETSD